VESSAALIAFVGVSSLDRAAEFYGRTLGLDLADERPFALSTRVRGTMLRITEVSSVSVAPYTALGFEVPDVAGEVDRLVARGVAFARYEGMDQDERRDLDGAGRRAHRLVPRPRRQRPVRRPARLTSPIRSAGAAVAARRLVKWPR
jgi:catechol 2,3-dioxygenase-like lactoylglutathione lyase family enzyme